MVFERAKPEDFLEVNRLARQVCEHHAQWDKTIQLVDEIYPMDYFLECVQDNPERDAIYVVRKEGKVVGFVRFYFWETNSSVSAKRKILTIDDIGVDVSLRNQGIGQRMMADLQELARAQDCSALNLYVDAPNESAIAFYQKCGLHIRNHGMTMAL